MRRFLTSLAALALTIAGCEATVCAGGNCTCPSNQTCGFDTCSATTSSCNFSCGSGATCTGTCGPACNVSCGGKSCTHTVGAGSNVACTAGACNITCEGSCTVSGSVTLTCGGGTSKSVTGCL